MHHNQSTLLIAFLILALIASLTLVFRTTIFYSRASVSNTSPAVMTNSYLFASPLQAKADSLEQIRITVFILDGRGLGIPNQTVSLRLPANIAISNSATTTDETGKAYFDISSSTATKFEIEATSNSSALPQKVKVTFY